LRRWTSEGLASPAWALEGISLDAKGFSGAGIENPSLLEHESFTDARDDS